MYKSKAIVAAVFFVALAVFFLYEISGVFSPGSNKLYKDVPPPAMMKKAEKNNQAAPAQTKVKKEKTTQTNETASKQASDVTTNTKQTASEAVTTVENKAKQAATTVEKKVETATATAPASTSQSATKSQIHVVKAEGLSYHPMVVEINPGDTVAWENMSIHDTQALKGLIPKGAKHWHSKLGEDYQRTFTKQGIYIYKCTPHFGLGMGGVIIVGKPVNLDAIKAAKVEGVAKRFVKKAIAAAEKM